MPYSTQHTLWCWEEAFAKFGFGDGDGPNFTNEVADYLRSVGFEVDEDAWGCHNITIISIKSAGYELIPFDDITYGYDNPRNYLPKLIIRLLDRRFPAEGAEYFF